MYGLLALVVYGIYGKIGDQKPGMGRNANYAWETYGYFEWAMQVRSKVHALPMKVACLK